MIEWLVVLAVMGIGGIMAAATFASILPHFRLKEAATQVRGELRFGRTLAVVRNLEHRLVFDVGSESYRIERGNKAEKSDVWTVEESERRFPRGVDLANVTAFKDDTVVFNPNGTVEGVNGSVYLRTATENCSVCSTTPVGDCVDKCSRVRLLSATGQVQIQTWDGKKWK